MRFLPRLGTYPAAEEDAMARTGSAVAGRVPHPGWRAAALLALSLAAFAWVVRQAPLAQDPAYHDFADQRSLLGAPHFWNVVSNLPFAVIGLLGCWWLIREGRGSPAFAEPGERAAYFVFFLGEILTCFGSAYYHSAPSNATLVWDRMVFSLMLTSFFAIVVTEFVGSRVGRWTLAPMVLLGLFSVWYWHWTESAGRGDLRLYLLVQFYPVVAIPFVALLLPSRYGRAWPLLLAWALYGVAKACEVYDAPIYDLTGFWSGHTFKHLAAAAASYLPLHGLRHRRGPGRQSSRFRHARHLMIEVR
jgi:predicted membrane channel-forming protein YqfA (hemolysin III family)